MNSVLLVGIILTCLAARVELNVETPDGTKRDVLQPVFGLVGVVLLIVGIIIE